MGRWPSLPAPDLPDGLVLFDGVCVLCSGWVRFIIERDPDRRFRFVPIQSELGRALAQRFGIDPDDPQTNLVVADGLAHRKSDSALAALSRLPGWRWTRALRVLPKPLRDVLYDRIARNRYSLFGRTETCLMPTPDIMARFLSTEAELRAGHRPQTAATLQ